MQLADDRINIILMDPNYDALDTLYVATEQSFPDMPGFSRVTTIQRVGGPGQAVDYKRVTVIVTGPPLNNAIKRSATVAAP